jgi:hypothetical protein
VYFYLAPGTNEAEVTQLGLWIEAKIEFPNPDAGEGEDGIAEYFRHMAVDGPDGGSLLQNPPRSCLVAQRSLRRQVEQNLFWIVSAEADPPRKFKEAVSAHDRANIALIYVPASRDPASQLRQAFGTLLQPLLKAIEWAATTRNAATQAATQVRDAVRGEAALQTLEQAITAEWNKLQSNVGLQSVQLQPLDTEFE